MHLRVPDENILWIFVVEDTESESWDSDSEDWYSLDFDVLLGQSLTESAESDFISKFVATGDIGGSLREYLVFGW